MPFLFFSVSFIMLNVFNMQCRHHVARVDLGNFLGKGLLLDQDDALIVVLMVIGLVIARLGTGRTNVIAVGTVVILKRIVRTVPKNSSMVFKVSRASLIT